MIIASPVGRLDELLIESLPSGKKVNVTAAVRFGRDVFLLKKSGGVANATRRDGYYILGSNMDEEVKALFLLGVITKSERDSHLKASADARKKSDDKWNAISLNKMLKSLGIKLTPGQLRMLPEHVRKEFGAL